MRKLFISTSVLLAAVALVCASAVASANFESAYYMRHVEYLASDELEGRMSGTEGCRQAAVYIASSLYNSHIHPGVDGVTWFQEFEFTSGVELGEGNTAEWITHGQSTPLEVEKDFTPVFFSPNVEVEGGLVFAGYGISAAQDENYDDYAEISTEGKVVVVLRGEPQTDDDAHFAGKRPTAYSDLRYKAFNAKKNGAVGMIVVTGPLDKRATDEDRLMGVGRSDVYGESAIPIIHIKRDKIEEVMDFFGGDLRAMQTQMDEELAPATLDMSYVTARIKTDLVKQYTKTENVIGVLPGTDLADEYIVIGAHYDHLGYGEGGTTLPSEELEKLPMEERIHNGADDNASGTAAVLEIADYFGQLGGNRRTLVFIAFSAEELGILGSLHYIKNPVAPIDKTVAMINFDMIGRVQNKVITLQGIGTAAEWTEILDKAAKESPLTLKRFDDGVGGSDYTSFYTSGVPVLNFFSGVHTDYHRPTDTADKINSEDAVEVLEIAINVILELNEFESLTFQKTLAPETTGAGQVDQGGGFNVYLGTIPDYSYTGSDGVLIAGVREGSPAEIAGMQSGDILVQIGDAEIKNIYDFTYALQDHKPGDVVLIAVIRAGERVELSATLRGR